MIGSLYKIFFFQPLANILAFLINTLPLHDLGFAIIILTVFVKLVLLPFAHHSTVTQRKMREIEPKIAELKEKLKNNKEEQAKQTIALYRAHGISPFSSFLALFFQLPVLIALFLLLKGGPVFGEGVLYSFVRLPLEVNINFLGILDLLKPSYIIAVLAGISQFFQIYLSMPNVKNKNTGHSFSEEFQKGLAVQMKYIMPIVIVFIAAKFSSGVALYWTISNVFAIVHEVIVARKVNK